jgi:tetratricopeptide (TPR) repeat protein
MSTGTHADGLTGIPLRAPRRTIAVLAFLAYLPCLTGEFVYDDVRFVEKNEKIRSLANAPAFFTDPRTLAPDGSHGGIYRPIRTLDFAIDHVLSGGSPFFFHLRNVLYHILGAILVFLIARELPGRRAEHGAVFAGLLFALHPVNTESVAFITSRGDVLLLVTFLGALLLHLRGRRRFAAAMLVVSLFCKETAVMFPFAALLVDRLAGVRSRWGWYGLYAGLAGAYLVLWFFVAAGGEFARTQHVATFWGGSYLANLLTMSKGFLYYAQLLLFPIRLLNDYHVPAAAGFDVAAMVALVVVVALFGVAIAGSPRSRFAALWFFVIMLPTSNLLRPIGIPTAERFLYLPLVGVMIGVGPHISRRIGLGLCISACFFLLTFSRCFDWRTIESFYGSINAVAETPRGLSYTSQRQLDRAHEAQEAARTGPILERDRRLAEMNAHARRVVEIADRFERLYEAEIRIAPSPDMLSKVLAQKANALLLLGRHGEAREAADRALHASEDLAEAWYNAALALYLLGEKGDAAVNLEQAHRRRHPDVDSGMVARFWQEAGVMYESRGRPDLAVRCYENARRWDGSPRTELSAEALRRLRGD